jgi:hypothetical protein
MADNLTTQSAAPATLPPNIIIATDELAGGVHVQEVKINVGGDGIDQLLSPGNPLPVSIQNASLEISNDVGNPVPISGVVAISNASLEISNDVGNPVPISGVVTITNASLEISNDVGNPVPVNIAGVTVGEKPAASSLPVVLATENSSDFLVPGPAAQSVLNSLIIPVTDVTKYRFVSVQINSTATAGTYVFEVSNDGGTTWVPIALQDAAAAFSPVTNVTATATNRIFQGAISAALFRARISVGLTGALQAFANFSQAIGPMGIQSVMSASTLLVTGNGSQGAATPANLMSVSFESRLTARAVTADATASRPIVDKLGRIVVVHGQIRELTDTNTLTLSTVTETTLIAAVAAVANDIRDLIISNTSAVDVRVDLRDSTAGTVRLSILVKAGQVVPMTGISRLKQAAVNTSWTVQLSAAVTDVRITAISERVS